MKIPVRMCSGSGHQSYETLALSRPREHVVQVTLNRPDKSNAMNRAFLKDFGDAFSDISKDSNCRVVVLSGAGKNFCGGLDLAEAGEIFMSVEGSDAARKAKALLEFVKYFQDSLSSVEICPQPVIAAIHGGCIGGGIDLVSACDIRYTTKEAFFQIKEVDIGLAADVGTLQRMPKVVGNESLMRELAYTARKFTADEANRLGFVSEVYADKDELVEKAVETAALIASKSPVAIFGTKRNLNFSRDHTVQDGLLYAATWSMSMLQTNDLMSSAQAMLTKTKPEFDKL